MGERRGERATIDALLDRAGEDGQRGVLFTGEPGIGRTTILEHAKRTAVARGWRVLSARGDPTAAEHAFDALGAIVRRLDASIPSLPPRLATALRVATAIEPGTAEPQAIGAGLLRLVADEAEVQPVLLALDDVHWFDHSSASALSFLHRHLDGEPVATVATALTGHELDEGSWTRMLALRPLDGLELGDLLPLLGEIAVEPGVAERCRELTAGNPLGFVELVRSLRPRQRAGEEPLPDLPDPGPIVTQAFARRLERLPQRTRRALTVVAADETGRLGVVRAALGLLGASADLQPADTAGIIAIDGDDIAFTHPLLRVAAYHGVAPSSRRKAHQALAAALDQPRDAEHRAWQLAAAVDGPDEEVAASLVLVADSATARGAVTSAARVLEQAAARSVDPELVAQRLTAAGELWLGAGEVGPAATALERARASVAAGDVPVGTHLWAALAARWTRGPLAAAAGLRAAMTAAGVDDGPLAAAAADEEQLAGTATARSAEPELGPESEAAAHHRALLRVADRRLDGELDAIRSVPGLLAALSSRSPLALDGTARTARALVIQGDLLGAYGHLTAMLAAHPSTIDGARVGAELELARVEVLLGRSDEAAERLGRVALIAMSLGMGALQRSEQAARGLLALGAGRFDEAVALLAPIDRPGGADEIAIVADHLEATTLAGRAIDVRWWRARIESVQTAPGSLAAGLVERAVGLVDDDPRALDVAARQLAPFPFERARALLLHAERWSVPDRAEEALRGFESVGAVAWAERAARARGPREGTSPATDALASLTAAELRVAVAVGAGRSNREAADELFLSVKTVDHHLQHIYRKLDVRGRVELAVLVTRGSA